MLAFLLGALALRLRLSPLVGYLAAGVLVGPFTPGFVGDQGLSTQLAEIGVILLMFGVGLHFSLSDLLAVRGIAVPGAVVQIGVATALGTALGVSLGWHWGEGLVFGIALSVAGTVVLLRALEERRLIETSRGRIAVGWLIVEDLAMVLALVLLPAFSGALGGRDEGGDTPLWLTLATTLGAAVAFVALMLVVGRRVVPRLLERAAGTGSRELFTLGVLALAMGIAFGSAELFGVSFALGAFFAGMVLNESELSHAAAEDSLPLRDAFAVLFFVSVGMLFDPAIILDEPLALIGTVLVIVVGKTVAAWLIVRLFGHPAGTASTVAVSLGQIGEFSFILVGLAVSLEVMSGEARDLVLAGAILSIALNPLLFGLLDRRTAREAADAGEAELDAAEGHAIVVGHGRVGARVTAGLRERGTPVVVVEEDEDRAAAARAAGARVVRGNAASEDVLAAAAPARARLVVLAIPRPLEAGHIAQRVRAVASDAVILARAHTDAEVAHLVAHGADRAIMAEQVLADALYGAALGEPAPAGTP